MTDPLDLDSIVRQGLCIGCGLCQSIAGGERVRMCLTRKGVERPQTREPLDLETLRLINAVCPGLKVAGPGSEVPDGRFDTDPVWGPAGRLAIAHASDPEVRHRAATGGVLTALGQYLLATDKVDGVLHVRASDARPMRSEACLSRTPAEVLAACGSRYGPAAALTELLQHVADGLRLAVIAKPCDIGAVRLLAREDERVARQVKYLLAMVCGGASELGKSRAVLKQFGVREEELTLFRYRGHGNPGPTRLETRDGRAFELGYNEMWAEEKGWQLQFRCKICPDAIGEQTDIAAADVWPGGSPEGEDAGFNGVLARTPAGLALFEEALAAGALTWVRDIDFRDMDDFQPHQVRKKHAVHDRLQAMAEAGMTVPDFQGLRLAELARQVDPEERARNYRGMLERLERGANREPVA